MILRPLPLLGAGLLYEDGDVQVHLVRPGSELFGQIVAGRAQVSCGPATDPIDEHSTHYALTQAGHLRVWFRVTRAHQGPLDCQAFYPPELIWACRDVLASTGRLGRHPADAGRSSLVTLAMRCGWGHQFACGARIDVINARTRLAPFYMRLHYPALPGWTFTHPRTGDVHDVRALAPAEDITGSWGDVFQGVPVATARPYRARLAALGSLVPGP